jgi:hypothetical protein
MSDAFTWGSGGNKLTAADRNRRMAEALIAKGTDTSPVQHWAQGLNRVAQALLGGMYMNDADRSDKAGAAGVAADAALLMGGGGASPAVASAPAGAAPSMAGGGGARTMAMPNVSPEIKDGIVQTASALGISPVDLATTISYETGGTFDPTKAGPTTKWGQHRGLIQFGEPQAKQHGVDWSNPVASQLGANGAVASYLKTAGVQPGMGLLDIYSAINAGAPGLYNRSDAAAGGAPGTVRDKVEQQMAGHRAKAQRLFADLPAPGASPVELGTGQPGFAIPEGQGAVESVPGDDPAKLRADAQVYAQSNPEAARQLLARADAAEAAVAPAMMPPSRPADLAVAAPAAPAMTAQNFNAITAGTAGQPLAPLFQSEGVAQPWMGTALAPQASAPAMVAAPMPPVRPADLPAPSAGYAAVPGQGNGYFIPPGQSAPPPAMPDLSNENGAGAREFAVAESQRAAGQPSGAAATSPFAGIAQALTGSGGAPVVTTATSPAVARVAQAVAATDGAPAPAASSPAVDRVATAMRVLNSPYAQPGQRAVAQAIVQQSLKDPQEAELKRLTVEKARREAENAPLDTEGRKLDIETKKKNLGKVDAPTTKVVKQADGSEVALQWDPSAGEWVPLKASQGGNAVTGSPGNPYALPGKPTESQSKDAGFASRMVESHNLINGLESVGTDKNQAIRGSVPVFGNQLSSPDKQKFEQAKRNFVTSILRKESGAAISSGEFETEEKKYFPQIGDSADVIRQKREARELAIEGVMAGAGSGYKVPESYKPMRGQSAATPSAAPDRSALEAEARRRGLIK